MKSVLISIQPKWCELIASGKKTIEVRKTRPKIDTPFRCYIYCTISGGTLHKAYDGLHYHSSNAGATDESCVNGYVIGAFVCDAVFPLTVEYSDPIHYIAQFDFPYTCLTDKQVMDYLGNGKQGYCWHISDLVIYDIPKAIRELKSWTVTKFGAVCYPLKSPPLSWRYILESEIVSKLEGR